MFCFSCVYLHISFLLQTFDEVERHQWESMENEWEREKQKILNTLLGSGPDLFDFQPETYNYKKKKALLTSLV